jgi:hypothetical protein
MTYTKTQDGQVTKFPYTIGDLHKDNPQTSFPRRIPDEMLASYEVFEVVVGAAPSIDETTYRAVRADTPTYAGDKWHLEWSVVEKTPEEKQNYYNASSARVRAKRNQLLSDSDWMALSDSTMTTEWASYRQALRDITSQGGFPYTIEWPTKPGE